MRRLMMIAVVQITLAWPCRGRAAEDPIYAPIQNGATTETMGRMGNLLWRTHCRRPTCQAILDFSALEEKFGHRDFPNSSTPPDPSKFDPRIYDRRVNHLLTLHKERHAALCTMIATVLSHIVEDHGTIVGQWHLEVASRLDSMDRPGCLAAALTALAPDPAGDKLSDYVRFACKSIYRTGPDRHRNCDRFTRPGAQAR